MRRVQHDKFTRTWKKISLLYHFAIVCLSVSDEKIQAIPIKIERNQGLTSVDTNIG